MPEPCSSSPRDNRLEEALRAVFNTSCDSSERRQELALSAFVLQRFTISFVGRVLRVFNEADQEDICQNVMIKLLKEKTFDSSRAALPFFITIIKRETFDLLTHSKKHAHQELSTGFARKAYRGEPAGSILMDQLLSHLREEDRELVWLIYGEGFSDVELAEEVYGLPVHVIRYRRKRALEALEALISKNTKDDDKDDDPPPHNPVVEFRPTGSHNGEPPMSRLPNVEKLFAAARQFDEHRARVLLAANHANEECEGTSNARVTRTVTRNQEVKVKDKSIESVVALLVGIVVFAWKAFCYASRPAAATAAVLCVGSGVVSEPDRIITIALCPDDCDADHNMDRMVEAFSYGSLLTIYNDSAGSISSSFRVSILEASIGSLVLAHVRLIEDAPMNDGRFREDASVYEIVMERHQWHIGSVPLPDIILNELEYPPLSGVSAVSAADTYIIWTRDVQGSLLRSYLVESGIPMVSRRTVCDGVTSDLARPHTTLLVELRMNAEPGVIRDVDAPSLPEPSTYSMLGLGLSALALYQRRRR